MTSPPFPVPLLLLALWSSPSLSAEFMKNGYHNIVVQIGDNLDQEQCPHLIHSIQSLFRLSSSALFRATKNLAYIHSVAIVIPTHWEPSMCGLDNNIVTRSSFSEADIVVGKSHPVYGDRPFTEQVGGCEVPGKFIGISESFLLNLNGTSKNFGKPAHVFVKEWTKYRYGVFDELGYAGDLLYPAFFKAHTPDRSIDGVPTACTNSPVQGQNNCIAGKCFFRPDPSNLNLNVTSSLLSFPQLDNVDEFCDGGSHDPIPPTKHNVLCASRSVWDIITRHHDFRDVPPITGMPYTSPTFEFRKVGPRNIVFALDWTQSMGQQGRWKNVRASIYRVLELLKAGSGVKYRPIRVGIVHFTTTAREFKDLTPIENLLLSSASLVKRYPGREEMRCVTCGVRKALEILAQDNEGPITGSEIVIISQELNIGDQLNSVLQELVDKGVRVHSVVYPDSPYKEIQLVSKATGGRSATITSSAVAGDPAASTKALMDTMAAVESVTNVQRTTKIFQAMKTPSAASGVISDRFPIDSALAANKFQLLVYYSSLESGKPRSMELSSPTGQRFGDFVPSPIGYNADLITVEHQNLKNGLWSYRIEMINPIPVLVEVRAFQAEFASSPLTLSIATSWDKQEGISETERRNPAKTPLVIYGFLRRGEAPVLRAKVTAHVHITSRDEDRVVTVDLRDTGNGAPDIQSGDGIYSAHFSDFLPRKAKYSISAVAEDGGGAVYVTRRPDANDIACCGSSIGEVDTAQTGAFYRLEAGPSFFVQTPPTDDVFPPSRVTDLRAEVQQEYNYNMVSLLWTSPGGDYELGKADHYELLYSRYLDDILTRNLSSMHRITNLPRPALAGSAQEADAVVKDGRLKHGIVYYFVLRSFHGRWSEISNIVSASIPFPPTAPPFPPSPASREERTAGLELGEWIAVAVACAFAVVLILIFVFCYCMVMKKKRIDKANGYLKEGEMQEYEKQLPPGVSTISGPGANFISASTILDEHERRKSISKSRQGSLADGLPGDSYENNNEGRVSRYGVIPPTSFEDSMSHSSGGHAHSDSPVDSRGIPLLPSQDYSGRNYPGMSRRPGPPPPVAPKPNLRERLLALQEQNLSGSRTSVSSDKRIPVSSVRNITQV